MNIKIFHHHTSTLINIHGIQRLKYEVVYLCRPYHPFFVLCIRKSETVAAMGGREQMSLSIVLCSDFGIPRAGSLELKIAHALWEAEG